MNQLTKGNGKTIFKWTPTQQQAFEQLKNKLCTALVLVLPYLHHPFEIETGTSNYALGAVITQCGQTVAFHYKIFNGTIRRYLTYAKDLYVIVQALKKWRHYILGKETIILIGHKLLQFSMSQSKLQTTRKIKWINYLQQFLLVIKYQKVKSNVAADCLN